MKKNPLKDTPAEVGSGKTKPGPPPDQSECKVVDESYLQHLEEENQRLKMAVADLTLRNQALKTVVGKKW